MPKWTFSGQNGVPGHCMVAQVWKDGRACIEVEPTVDPAEATEIARQVALAMNGFPLLLAACRRLDEIDCCDGYEVATREYHILWDALNMAREAIKRSDGV